MTTGRVGGLTAACRQYFIDCAIRGIPASPQLWVGLLRRLPADIDEPLAEIAALEPSSATIGYKRKPVQPQEWEVKGVGVLTLPPLEWQNYGLEPWPEVAGLFLVTTSDNSGIALWVRELPRPHVLIGEDRLLTPLTIA